MHAQIHSKHKNVGYGKCFFFRWQASVFNLIKILIINSITNKSIEYYKLIASYSDAQFEFWFKFRWAFWLSCSWDYYSFCPFFGNSTRWLHFLRIDLDAPTFGAVSQNCPKLLARKTINFHNIPGSPDVCHAPKAPTPT